MKGIIKSIVFVNHIEKHLKSGEVVICKICGKTIDEIFNEFEERK